MDDIFDLEKLKKEQEDAKTKKDLFTALGTIAQGAQSVPTSYELLYGGKINRPDVAGTFNQLAKNVEDPSERQAKLFQAYKGSKEMEEFKKKDAQDAILKDPNSQASKAAKAMAQKYGIPFDENTTAYELHQQFDPKKMREVEASSAIEFDKQMRLKKEDNKHQSMERAKDRSNAVYLKTLEEGQKVATKNKDATKKMSEFDNRYQNIQNEIAALDKLLEQYGTNEFMGSHNNTLMQKIQSISTDSAKLFDPDSVARESEVAGFQKMLFEPGTLTMSDNTAREVLKSYKDMLEKRAQVARETWGSGLPQQSASNPSAPSPTSNPEAMRTAAQLELAKRMRAKQTKEAKR